VSTWDSEPGITEIPVKQFMHFRHCIDEKAVLCFRPGVHCSSFGGSTAPMGKPAERIKKGHTVLFLGDSSLEAKSSPDPTREMDEPVR